MITNKYLVLGLVFSVCLIEIYIYCEYRIHGCLLKRLVFQVINEIHTFLNISPRKVMFYLQCTNTCCLKITGHWKFRTKYRRSSGIPANLLHTPWTSPLLYSSGALYVAKILRIRGNFRSNDTGKSGFEKFSGVCPRVTAFNFELRPGRGKKRPPPSFDRIADCIMQKSIIEQA